VAAKLNGVFIDRFHSVMERDEVLRQDFVYFEEKPLVMKICCVGQCVETNEIAKILVWVKFPEFDFTFWSKEGVNKISSLVGGLLSVDKASKDKSKTRFVHVLIQEVDCE